VLGRLWLALELPVCIDEAVTVPGPSGMLVFGEAGRNEDEWLSNRADDGRLPVPPPPPAPAWPVCAAAAAATTPPFGMMSGGNLIAGETSGACKTEGRVRGREVVGGATLDDVTLVDVAVGGDCGRRDGGGICLALARTMGTLITVGSGIVSSAADPIVLLRE